MYYLFIIFFIIIITFTLIYIDFILELGLLLMIVLVPKPSSLHVCMTNLSESVTDCWGHTNLLTTYVPDVSLYRVFPATYQY